MKNKIYNVRKHFVALFLVITFVVPFSLYANSYEEVPFFELTEDSEFVFTAEIENEIVILTPVWDGEELVAFETFDIDSLVLYSVEGDSLFAPFAQMMCCESMSLSMVRHGYIYLNGVRVGFFYVNMCNSCGGVWPL
ncbi:MAG: hypothetical protein FWG63_07505 [Defluviitaleaceae bacterium]|nr:hypothetical protein [Defluviitaleaceae bacterium]